MGTMTQVISPDWVLLDIDVEDREKLIRKLVDLLDASGVLSNAEALYHDILARENLVSTGIGFGCAIPHAHSKALDKTVIAAARLSKALDFGAPDGKPVSLVFLMAGPGQCAGLHLKLLSKLARMLHDAQVRENLLRVDNAREFYRLVCEQDY